MNANQQRISVVMIGAGNLASSLAVALYSSNYHIIQVYSRGNESAQQLATIVKSKYTTQLADIVHDADIYIISIPDKAIQEVTGGLIVENGIVVHTSGSTDIEVLSKFKTTGYGTIYPFQTFSKIRIIPFSNIPICLNANSDETFNLLHKIASSISNNVIRMDSKTLIWLHLTGVLVNNFTNHLLATSYRISQEKGFNFELLKPLVEETVKKAFELNPIIAQTGPAIRFDQNTIDIHIERLKEFSPELAETYKTLTLSIQSLAKKSDY